MIANLTAGFANPRSITILKNKVIEANEKFESNDQHIEIVDFSSLRFSDVRTILLFRAWVECSKAKHPNALYQAINFEKNIWTPYFSSVGLFTLFDDKTRQQLKTIISTTHPTIMFRCKKNQGNDKRAEPHVAFDVAKLFGQTLSQNRMKMNLIGACVNEALHNCLNWGYENQNSYLNKKWWVAARTDKSRKEFNFVVYDHGIGASARFKSERLQSLGLISNLLNLSSKSSDTEVLQGMMKMDDEGIRQLIPDGRCRGLAQMKRLILNFPRGHFSIRSGYGEYDCMAMNGKFRSETTEIKVPNYMDELKLKTNAGYVPGTLLSWTLSEKVSQ